MILSLVKKYICVFSYKVVFIILLCVLALPVFAANLFVSPSSGVYTEGDVFNVLIYVTSDDQAMNAIEGTLTYPQQYLQAQTLSTTNSVISFWIKAPSAADGTVKFEGIVPNPGFTGSFGKVLTIPFKALQPGVAQLSFSSGSVLANDGLATELLSVTQGAVFVIEEAVIEEIPPEESAGTMMMTQIPVREMMMEHRRTEVVKFLRSRILSHPLIRIRTYGM